MKRARGGKRQSLGRVVARRGSNPVQVKTLPRSPIYRETVCSYYVGDFSIRAWREAKKNEDWPPRDLFSKIQQVILSIPRSKQGPAVVAEMLLRLPKINAVEVTWRSNGVVYYKDWP